MTTPAPNQSNPDPAALREAVLLAHDYVSLLERFGQAVEVCCHARVRAASIRMTHPDADNVRFGFDLKEGIVTAQRPAPATEGQADYGIGFPGNVLVNAQGEAIHGGVDPTASRSPKPPFGARLFVPLDEHGHPAGVMRYDFDASRIPALQACWPILEQLAAAARAVLPYCHEHERIRRERNEMQEIFESATMVQGAGSADALAELASRIAVERLGAERCLIMGYDKRQAQLYGLASHGFNSVHVGLRVNALDEGNLLARTFRRESPEWHAKLETELGIEDNSKHPPCHAISLPLLVGSRAVGVLYADHKADRAQVSPQRLLGLQLFANTLAAGIESAHLLAEVGRLADQDSLTGLANRRALDSALRREVLRAVRHNLPISLLMIDIDRFKSCNDEYGHLTGDIAIVATANILREATRQTDFVARYGGDEFCVIMPDTEPDQAEVVRQRIIEAVSRKAPELDKPKWHFSLSCGLRSALGREAEQLLEGADEALYEQKEAQVRAGLLQRLLTISPDEYHSWNHYLSRVLRVLYEKEPHYHAHALRTMNLCVSIARKIRWPKEEVECVALAALLHDVGKISIPSSLLTRPGPLSPKEYRIIKQHPEAGRDLLKEVHYLGDVVRLVAAHHERWDGNTTCKFPAYPGEVSGDSIPRGARLLKIADCFDAMTTARPYSTPVTVHRALEIIREDSGKAFDPELARTFIDWIRECSARPLVPVGL